MRGIGSILEPSEFTLDNKGKYLIFALFLIGLVVIFSYGVGNVSANPNTIYVNGSSGHDSNNGSSWLYAKKSIKNATGTVNKGGTVMIANGGYSGTNNTDITIDKNITINGQSKTGTIISGPISNWYISRLFYINPGTIVTLTNLTLTAGNTYDIGGGAIVNKGRLTITNLDFHQNFATFGYGGAIYNNGTLFVQYCNFTNNSALNQDCGAIYNNDSMQVMDSTFTNNWANGNNGAVYNNGVMDAIGCTFTNNGAYLNGGAIYNNHVLDVTNCNFEGNKADISPGKGGGIYNNGTLTVLDSIFTNNIATQGGAIMDYYNSILKIIGSTFKGNNATFTGGAIYNNDGTLNLTRSNIISNYAASGGGAIFNYGLANLNYNRIVGNHAPGYGSAINNYAGKLDVTLNWWGSNTGPSSGSLYGIMTWAPWLVLTVTAKPTTIKNYGNSIITADLIHDNNGKLQTGGYVPENTPIKFTTTLGKIIQSWYTINGVSGAILRAGTVSGTATVFAKIDSQTGQKSIKIIDIIPPKISLTSPTNGATGFSKTANIAIKFSELIKSSSNWSKIVVIDNYGHAVAINDWISVNNHIHQNQ